MMHDAQLLIDVIDVYFVVSSNQGLSKEEESNRFIISPLLVIAEEGRVNGLQMFIRARYSRLNSRR